MNDREPFQIMVTPLGRSRTSEIESVAIGNLAFLADYEGSIYHVKLDEERLRMQYAASLAIFPVPVNKYIAALLNEKGKDGTARVDLIKFYTIDEKLWRVVKTDDRGRPVTIASQIKYLLRMQFPVQVKDPAEGIEYWAIHMPRTIEEAREEIAAWKF